MRVAINASLRGTTADHRRAGVSRYIEEVLRHLPAHLGPVDELIVVSHHHARRGPLGRTARHPVGRIAWEQAALPVIAARAGWDLLHSPVNVSPVLARSRSVVTVHDLAFVHAGATMPTHRRRYLLTMTGRSVRRAARVLTISAATRDDLVAHFGVDPAKVMVTPLGVDPVFRPLPDAELQAFRVANDLARPYILSVGTREPRKNGAALVRAWARVAHEIPHDLVLVGPAGWLGGELDDALAALSPALRDRTRLTGFVPDADLPRWYAAADAFALPSRYEGFGLPVAEAMACGTPVLTSDVSSLPEVAGDAALLVDPADEAAIAAGLLRLVTDAALATDLRARGLRQAARFSWDDTARRTVAAYRAALDG